MLLSDEKAQSSKNILSKINDTIPSSLSQRYNNLKIADFGMSSIIENGNDSLK